ncbi:hypothetical protein ACQZ6H_25860 [Agrobacterium fabrum]|jgi:hypothetical protein|uniref:Peptidase U49 n=1 Tax=Agrobacterium fabrum TaxID=1176649 RepID=A0A7Z7FTR2_9HYPH|nr:MULTISPECIES: hypothetical protein [Pseudomonadota]SDK49963.1 hypothetical protein SAMN05428983_5124 [Agrobacterium fabrum]HWV07888.1 hypothetical protein [Ralstonia sp.]
MLTDLPNAHISSINDLLRQLGFNGLVLQTEGDDGVTFLARRYFTLCRKSIDKLTRKLEVRAKIYLCFILDSEKDLQACAVNLGEDEYCVAIWLAAPMRTIATITHLMSTSAIAQHFEYALGTYTNRAEATASDTFAAYRALGFEAPVDFDEPLKTFCSQIAYGAIEWLVYHELGHIINGHLELGKEFNGLTFILEDDPSDERDENLTSQALELDADCFATWLLLQLWLQTPVSIEEIHLGISEADKQLLRLRCFVFGVFAIVRGFDDHPFDVDTMFDFDHPPGVIRINYMIELIANTKRENKFPYTAEKIVEAALDTVVALEQSISQATGTTGGGGNVLTALTLGWKPFNAPVLSRWAKLYPILDKFKMGIGKLAAPQYPPA